MFTIDAPSFRSDGFQPGGQIPSDYRLMAAAAANRLYNRIRQRGVLRRLFARLRRENFLLGELGQVAGGALVGNAHGAGELTVPLHQVRGSENRTVDFDIFFYPLHDANKRRWLSIATARFLNTPLPAVELVLFCDTYYVRDGHHRISVARALGQDFIEALVTVWMPCSDESGATLPLPGSLPAPVEGESPS